MNSELNLQEHQILKLSLEGRKDSEIAARLSIEVSTLSDCKRRIMKKFGMEALGSFKLFLNHKYGAIAMNSKCA